MPKYNQNPTPLEIERRNRGLTRQKLAEISGVNRLTIKGLEQGRNNINNARAILVSNLADALGVPVKKILNIEGGDTDA